MAAVAVPVLRDTPVRALVGVPFVLFVPGYLVVSALFPERAEPEDSPDESDHGLSNLARFALSFPASVMVVAPLALLAVFSPWGLEVSTVVPLLVAFVGGMVVLIDRRRAALSPDERFRLPIDRWIEPVITGLTTGTTTDRALNVLLGLSVLLATSAVVYGVAVPPAGEPFSELYLTPVTSDSQVPDATIHLNGGETETLQMTVRNRERDHVRYTLLIVRQRVSISNDSITVLRSNVSDQYRPSLKHNETWTENYTISSYGQTGLFRVGFLLYRDDLPVDPTIENAYRQNNVFVNTTV